MLLRKNLIMKKSIKKSIKKNRKIKNAGTKLYELLSEIEIFIYNWRSKGGDIDRLELCFFQEKASQLLDEIEN